jgi:four helix bundle protein
MDLAERGYRATRTLGREDQFVLGHQIRKSAISIPSNIAEGFGRHSTGDYVHHLRIAVGSNNELQTQIQLACRLDMFPRAEVDALPLSPIPYLCLCLRK